MLNSNVYLKQTKKYNNNIKSAPSIQMCRWDEIGALYEYSPCISSVQHGSIN